MNVLVLVVGRVRGVLASAVDEYERRAARYWKLEVIEVKAGGSDPSPDGVRAAEGERILSRIPPGYEVVALTRAGRGMDSRRLAKYLEEHGVRATPGVAFVIGGAFGLDDSVLERARRTLAISAMTFPHEMARLFLAEQLYRSGTIIRGEPYHKG